MAVYHDFTEQQLKTAVKSSFSIRAVATLLQMNPDCGGSYYTLKKYIKLYNIDTSHFTGMIWNKGKTFPSKYPIEDYLSGKRKIQTFKLKKMLLKNGIFQLECHKCHLTTWLDKPIPTELHHKDGNKHNHSLDNLELLCPNCHAFTDSYRGKNKGAYTN